MADADIREMLNQKCDVYARDRVRNTGGGGFTYTERIKHCCIPCRIKREQGDEIVLQGRKQVVSTHVIYVENNF